MAKIDRKHQKVFGGDLVAANNIAEFGSLKAGSVAYSLDPDNIQSLSAYDNGWSAAVVSNNAPALQDMNALFYLATRQLAYLFQAGVPEWNAGATYYTGSVVQNGSGKRFVSRVDSNLNNALTDGTKWACVDNSVYVAKSADYSVLDSDTFGIVGMTTGASNYTVTLPTAADNANRILTIIKLDSGAGTCIVDGEGSETVEGATTFVLSKQYDSITVVCNGSAWFIVHKYIKTPWQIKKLTGNITSTTTATDLSYTLEVGKTYRITLNAYANTNNGSLEVFFKDGATSIAQWVGTDNGDSNKEYSVTTIRTMTNAALTFDVSKSGTATIYGDNTLLKTHVIVDELSNYLVSATW